MLKGLQRLNKEVNKEVCTENNVLNKEVNKEVCTENNVLPPTESHVHSD